MCIIYKSFIKASSTIMSVHVLVCMHHSGPDVHSAPDNASVPVLAITLTVMLAAFVVLSAMATASLIFVCFHQRFVGFTSLG